MKRRYFKYIVAGTLIAIIGSSAVTYASPIIAKFLYNDEITVNYFGREISLTNGSVSATNQGDSNAKTYAPLRELLEGMGYTVTYDNATQDITVDVSAASFGPPAGAGAPPAGGPPTGAGGPPTGAGGPPTGAGGPPQIMDVSAVISNKYEDLAYATGSDAQKLNIYVPNNGTAPYPVIIAIHGGGFFSGDKNSAEVNPQLEGLKYGYAVVTINYRLSGEAQWPAQVYDVKAAIRYIRANATKYNLDPNKIAAWGDSAGAYLASIIGTSGGVKELEDLTMGNADQSSSVQAVVDQYGPVNFVRMDGQFAASGFAGQAHSTADSKESVLLGKQVGSDPVLDKKTNPETYITADDPSFYIAHGANDTTIPTQQSIVFADNLMNVLGTEKVTLQLLQGVGHGGIGVNADEFNTAENLSKIYAFLDKTLK